MKIENVKPNTYINLKPETITELISINSNECCHASNGKCKDGTMGTPYCGTNHATCFVIVVHVENKMKFKNEKKS